MQYRHEIEHALAMLAPPHIHAYTADSFFFFAFLQFLPELFVRVCLS